MSEYEGPITSVPQLLAYHDAKFIRVAYEAVLGRGPDDEGRAHYLGLLRTGMHKLEILRQLRRSPEGRKFIPGVAGLDRAIKSYRQANFPVLGWIVRLITGAEGNSATQRQLRAIMNEIGRLHAEQSGLFQSVGAFEQLAAQSSGGVPQAAESPAIAPTPSAKVPALVLALAPIDFDSQERRVLGTLNVSAKIRGSAA